MAKARPKKPVKSMFSLNLVEFRDSAIAGRGVFARRAIAQGQVAVGYAPRQRRVPFDSPEAAAAAETRLTLLSGNQVILPDTSVPGGWLCNHSCDPNATLFASDEGRIEARRPIAPGQEVTIFYGWVTRNEPERDPCRCGTARCRGFINFDFSEADLDQVVISPREVVVGPELERRLAAYSTWLAAIGQEQVNQILATTLIRMKRGR